MKHKPTTIADLLWMTAMVACICYLGFVDDSRQIEFEGDFSALPQNDTALIQWLQNHRWTVDEVKRKVAANSDADNEASVDHSVRVVARNNYLSEGGFSPPWEELGYSGLQLQSLGTHPEFRRLIMFFVLWFAISIPAFVRWIRPPIRKPVSMPSTADSSRDADQDAAC